MRAIRPARRDPESGSPLIEWTSSFFSVTMRVSGDSYGPAQWFPPLANLFGGTGQLPPRPRGTGIVAPHREAGPPGLETDYGEWGAF